MSIQSLFNTMCHGFLVTLTWVQLSYAQGTPSPPPGTYERSSIGNSFSGGRTTATEGTGLYGYGSWVQDNIDAMAVSPDGTVFIETIWDEGGHGVGLYKNGLPNNAPIFAQNGQPRSHDFNTQGTAICVDGNYFYIAGKVYKAGSSLLRFKWSPGDVNSAQYLDQTALAEDVTGLSCSNGKILVGYQDKIELRDEAGMQLSATYPAGGIESVLLAPDGSFWTIAGDQVHHLRPDGSDTGITLPGVGKPSSLAWSNNGKLMVSDNGPAQQVLIFDVSGQPRLTSSFGVKNGLYSAVPGAVAPQKLFALHGANMDAEGNLYVGMSFTQGPNGNAFLRAFSPAGTLLWEDYATAWVDTFGFQPGSDGTVVYGRTTRWKLNLDQHGPNTEAALTAITLDPLRYPDDPRIIRGYAVNPRFIDGTQLLYANSQYGAGFVIFAGSPGTDILHEVARTPPGLGWASVTDGGDIWAVDPRRKNIVRYSFKSVTDGQPIYDWQNPQTWPWPADFAAIHRVIYNQATDSLYVFGFLEGQPTKDFDITLGLTARRYDGWLSGNPHIVWTNASLPTLAGKWRLENKMTNAQIPPKDVSLAGDYLFVGMLRDMSTASVPRVNILNANSGTLVGEMTAGPEVGLYGGWEDIVGSVQATERNNGEYLVLVEDDEHARNLLFRWKP